MTYSQLDDLLAFTSVFAYCRPKLEDYFVYEVIDYGVNLELHASRFIGDNPVGESESMLISKEWVVDNLKLIFPEWDETHE